MYLNINDLTHQSLPQFALFNLGFRIFFLAASIFAIVAMFIWAAVFLFQLPIPIQQLTSHYWHAHEMLYGYAMAVIAGFLLTAVKNWTGVQTVYGKPLALLFSFWFIARLFFLFGDTYLIIASIFDMLFSVLLLLAVTTPVVKTRQWKQSLILGVLSALILCNFMFYLGAFNIVANGLLWGVYGGLYLIMGLIILMVNRVLPFFIEKGINYPVRLFQARWLDITNLILFISFLFFSLIWIQPTVNASIAFILFVLNTIKLIGWHTPGIWARPLLWSLYLSYGFICLGFLLHTTSYLLGTFTSLALHAFAVGGIGVMTMGMMARVSLGHTGRSIQLPPKTLAYAIGILLLATVFRVILPLFDMTHYFIWVGLSQAMWILAFGLFIFIYLPILIRPRVDNQFG